MALTRDSTGLLFRDQFDRADGAPGADYTVLAGTFGIVSQELSNNPFADHDRIAASAVAAREEILIQARTLGRQTNSTGHFTSLGLMGRYDSAADKGYMFALQGNAGSGFLVILYRRNPGGWTELQRAVVNWVDNTWYTQKFYLKDSVQKGWHEGVLRVSQADGTHDAVAGLPAFRNSYTGGAVPAGGPRIDDLIVCTSNSITCSGLPTGWKIRVGTIVATESGGTATLDLAGTTLPAATLEVLDSGDVVQDSFATVWGGDTFTFTAVVKRTVTAHTGTFTASAVSAVTDRIRRVVAHAGAFLAAAVTTVRAHWVQCAPAPATAWTECASVESGGTLSGYEAAVLALNPWGYWKLNEAGRSGVGDMIDSSGNGRHGTYKDGVAEFGLPGFIEGDKAVRDGGDVVKELGTLPITAQTDVYRNFTFSLWAKPSTTTYMPASADGDGALMVSKGIRWVIPPQHGGGQAATGNAGFGLSFGTNGIVTVEYADLYAPPRSLYEAPFPTDEYTHIVVAVDQQEPGEKSIHKIYVNGQYAGTLAGRYEESPIESGTRRVFAGPFVGGDPSAVSDFGFGGILAELELYDYVLSDAQIANLYEQRSAVWAACAAAPATAWSQC